MTQHQRGGDSKKIDTDPHIASPDLNGLHTYLIRLREHFLGTGYRIEGWAVRYRITFNPETRNYEARARTYG